MPRLVRSLVVLVTGCLAALALLAGPLAAPARAETAVSSMVVDAALGADGTLTVSQTLTFAGTPPGTLVQRLETSATANGTSRYRYDISGVTAKAGATDLGATTSSDADLLVISVPTAKAAGQPVVVTYTVKGAVAATTTGGAVNTFRWRFLQGLSVPVTSITGTVKVPAMISWIDCRAGVPTAPGACQLWAGGTHDAPLPTFTDGPRGAGEVVVLSFGVPAGKVKANARVTEGWSLDRAFRPSVPSATLAMLTLLLGAGLVWLLHRRAGRDVRAVGEPVRVAEFAPVAAGQSEFRLLTDIRPGHVGTVADERVDPVDVTATLIDLAVRGHLRIHELPQQPHEPLDWRFERLSGGRGTLRPYEQVLLDAVAPAAGEGVTVTGISQAVGGVILDVQSKLYDDVVEHGWFERRPDNTRNTWALVGWIALVVALVATGLLIAFTSLGLWGLALVLVAAALLFVAPEMPRRSHLGSQLLAGLHLLSFELQHHRTDEMPPERAYDELSELLPYAIVLGGKDRWLQALADADDDPDIADPEDLTWYHAPGDWHLQYLPASLDAFITSVQGRLFGR